MWKSRNSYTVFVVKCLEKWSLGRLRRRLEDNIKISLREIGCEDSRGLELV
jgi:hypothetical protein